MEHALKVMGDYAFMLSSVGSIIFLILYSVIARWWRTFTGRFIFTFMAVISALILLAAIRLWFGPYPGVTFIRPIALIALAAIIWALVIMLVARQVRGYRQRRQ